MEFQENTYLFNTNFVEQQRQTAGRDPLEGHAISSEMRTKMADWMIEVTSSFKCVEKTYYLAVQIFDKYLIATKQMGKSLKDSDIHMVGMTSMYMASKFHDVFPCHSTVVAQQIGHGLVSPKEIIDEEERYLKLFGFDINFATHYDFMEIFMQKIQFKIEQFFKFQNTDD